MGTDNDSTIRVKADQQVQELDKKYPGFIQVTVNIRFTNIDAVVYYKGTSSYIDFFILRHAQYLSP